MRRLSSRRVCRGGDEVVEDRIAFLCKPPLGECWPSTLDTTRVMCLEPRRLLAPLLSYALGCGAQILAHTAVETQGALCRAPCVLHACGDDESLPLVPMLHRSRAQERTFSPIIYAAMVGTDERHISNRRRPPHAERHRSSWASPPGTAPGGGRAWRLSLRKKTPTKMHASNAQKKAPFPVSCCPSLYGIRQVSFSGMAVHDARRSRWRRKVR
jgi:hypothetical protein